MEDILRIIAATVAAAVCAVAVKQRAQEVGLILSLTAGTLALTMALGAMESVRAPISELGKAADLSPAVLALVPKTMGIAILAHISAEMYRDAKGSDIAAFMETTGAAVALCVALPLLRAMLNTVAGLL